MDVIVCKSCGRLTNYIFGPKLCPACMEELENKFQKVKTYIIDNPNSSIAKVSDECDVEIQLIKKWLREERLQLSSESAELTCDVCGCPIRYGKMCDSCRNGLYRKLNSILPEKKVSLTRKGSADGKMRFLSDDKK